MVQQTTDSKCIEYGLGNPEINPSPPAHDRRHPVAAKKTALRELQNENRVLIPKSPYSKEKAPLVDAVKVSGVKRTSQESAVSPSKGQYPSTNAANRHLVYVRRKFEADLGKSSSSSETSINAQHQPQMMEPKVHCFPAFAPMPMTSSISSSAKPTIPPFGKPIMNSAPRECNYHPVASSSPQLDNSRGIRNLPWEERSIRLQASSRLRRRIRETANFFSSCLWHHCRAALLSWVLLFLCLLNLCGMAPIIIAGHSTVASYYVYYGQCPDQTFNQPSAVAIVSCGSISQSFCYIPPDYKKKIDVMVSKVQNSYQETRLMRGVL